MKKLKSGWAARHKDWIGKFALSVISAVVAGVIVLEWNELASPASTQALQSTSANPRRNANMRPITIGDSRLLTTEQKAQLLTQSEGKRVTLVCESDTSGSCQIADDYAAFLEANGRTVARQYYDPQEYRQGVNFLPDNTGREVRIVVSGPPI